MQKKLLFTGIAMLGGAIGIVLGATTCYILIIKLFTDRQREFMYGATIYMFVAGVALLPISVKLMLRLGTHLYNNRQRRVLTFLSCLGYLITMIALILAVSYIFSPIMQSRHW